MAAPLRRLASLPLGNQLAASRSINWLLTTPLAEDKRDEITGTPLAVALWTAAQAVASKYHLPALWFNTLIGDFVRSTGGVPQNTLWHSYSPLEEYLPPKTYILVLKLLANRPKDRADIKVLCKALNIHTRKQAQSLITTYILTRRSRPSFPSRPGWKEFHSFTFWCDENVFEVHLVSVRNKRGFIQPFE